MNRPTHLEIVSLTTFPRIKYLPWNGRKTYSNFFVIIYKYTPVNLYFNDPLAQKD